MKRFLLAVGFLMATAAYGDEITSFSGLQTSGTYGCFDQNGQVTFCDLSGYRKVSVQVTSAAGSVATILIQIRNTSSDPWSTVATINNPGPAELGFNGPGVGQMQLVVTWTSGSLKATVKRMN